MKTCLKKCETYLEPVGRILIGAFFFLAGASKLVDLEGTATYIDSVGLPMASSVALLSAIFEIVAGLALIVGKYTKYVALLLAGFTLLASVLFHPPSTWEASSAQQLMFMKNLAIIGGLLFMAAHLTSNCHARNKSKETEDAVSTETNSL